MNKDRQRNRESGVHVPLDFERAVEGLLAVKPKKASGEDEAKAAKKKPATEKKASRKKKS